MSDTSAETFTLVDLDGRAHWRALDGTTFPVVAGGSDVPPVVSPAAEPAVDPTVAPTTDGAPEPAAPEGAPPASPWEGKTPEELWNTAEKIRKENLTYKERFRPWEESVGGMHPQDQALVVNFVKAIQSGDQDAIKEWGGHMRAALDQLSPAEQAAVVDAAEAATEFDPFKPENIDKRADDLFERKWQEREQQQQQQQAIRDAGERMLTKAKDLADSLGMPSLGDPTDVLHRALFLSAHNDFPSEPDPMVRLELAGAAIKERLQKQAQELLKAKGADAAPSPAPADAVEPSGERKPQDLRQAKAAASERIKQIMQGEVG